MSGRRKRQKGRERIERVVDHLGPLRRKVTWDFRTGRYLASEHNKPSERGENCRGEGGRAGQKKIGNRKSHTRWERRYSPKNTISGRTNEGGILPGEREGSGSKDGRYWPANRKRGSGDHVG